ncbi:MAG TPA: CocE/NonD family hydrolase [Steroidobacteraceae bacterium]|nr:CocE/NonD family hydrolase [Steroidobacteraceae bacterium]
MSIAAGFFALACCAGAPAAISGAAVGPGYDIELSRMIPMRDGVELEAWITKPSPLRQPAPAILTLTQYDIDGSRRGEPPYFARRGYVFVQAYVRGRGRSGGVKSDNLGLQVGRDGHDLVEWIAGQPWSNGQVVMYGGSFVGMTQWHTAAQLPPHLAAIAPYASIYPGWDIPNTNGIPQAWTAAILGYTSGRSLNPGFLANREYWLGKLLEQYAAQRPFSELDAALGIAPDDWWMPDEHGAHVPMMRMWLDHVGDEAFNLAGEPRPAQYAAMSFPVLTATGFFDDDQPGALRYYHNHLVHAPAAAAARHYLVIGPWDHSGTQMPEKDVEGLAIAQNAVLDMRKLHADWYDWALGRGPLPALLHDRVTYYMMGADEWRYARSLEDASSGRSLVLYLDAGPAAPGDAYHAGRLAPTLARDPHPSQLLSDPRELPELAVAAYAAEENLLSQFRAYQKRALVFQSEALAEDTEIAGPMRLVLVCRADAPDFDLWAQVSMIRPDGSAIRLGQDIRRARFRDGPFRQELVRPGEQIEIPFEFNWAAWRLPRGARLRLVLAPLNSPDYQKNYNTGGRIGYENPADARVAHVSIFHDAKRSSRLIVPLAAASAASAK